jgi:hypothetical protein
MGLSVSGGSVTKEALKRENLNKSGAGGVIGKVTATNYTGSSGTISTAGNFRVDRQNPSSTHANLQVQVNGITGEKSSVGGALVPLDLASGIGKMNAPGSEGTVAKARAAELTKAIQGALSKSVGTWKCEKKGQLLEAQYQTFVVSGKFSA